MELGAGPVKGLVVSFHELLDEVFLLGRQQHGLSLQSFTLNLPAPLLHSLIRHYHYKAREVKGQP